jgi:hypothetical protein
MAPRVLVVGAVENVHEKSVMVEAILVRVPVLVSVRV